MPYTRRFLHYSPTPSDFVRVLADRVVDGAWFELHRQGGCGDGEIALRDGESSGEAVDIGDWIAFEYDTNDRWYLGRVVNRCSAGYAAERLTLAGIGHQLEEVFPGGFHSTVADGVPPHRYAKTDQFSFDPDYTDETIDTVSQPSEVVRLIAQQYVEPLSDITYDANLVDDPTNGALVRSLKYRGEESAAAILRDLALRAGGFSWGVNADGKLFFLEPNTTRLATFDDRVNLVKLVPIRRDDLIFNRLLLTGGQIYDAGGIMDRWRGHYLQPASRDAYGERPIEITLPWIRTQADSREFAREFFTTYADDATDYWIEVAEQSTLLEPWNGTIRLRDASLNTLYDGGFEKIRVRFDHSPRFEIQLGRVDPKEIWPQPKHDERWPIAGVPAGGLITFGSSSSGGGSTSGGMSSMGTSGP